MFTATGVVSAGSAREPGSLPQGRLGLCWGPVRLVTSLDYGAALGGGGPENTLPSTRAYGGGRIGKPRVWRWRGSGCKAKVVGDCCRGSGKGSSGDSARGAREEAGFAEEGGVLGILGHWLGEKRSF